MAATGNRWPVSVEQGKMSYQWEADKAQARIEAATVTYRSQQHGTSSLRWTYDDFRSVGVKPFPARQSFTFDMTATGKKQTATVSFAMSEVGTDSKWDAETTVSDKYKKVETKDVFTKIMNM